MSQNTILQENSPPAVERPPGSYRSAAVCAIFSAHGLLAPSKLDLGEEVYRAILAHLRSECVSSEHADDIFQYILAKAHAHLSRQGQPILAPRAWLHRIRRTTTIDFLTRLARDRSLSLEDAPLSSLASPWEFSRIDEKKALAMMLQAVAELPPRQRQLVLLDLRDRLSPGQIEEAMGIQSNGYFRKLKSQAFRALRESLCHLISKGVGSIATDTTRSR